CRLRCSCWCTFRCWPGSRCCWRFRTTVQPGCWRLSARWCAATPAGTPPAGRLGRDRGRPPGPRGRKVEALAGRGWADRGGARRADHGADVPPGVVEGAGVRCGHRRDGHPRRPRGVDDQTRPGSQGHGQAAARARRHHGPPRLATAVCRRRLSGVRGIRAFMSMYETPSEPDALQELLAASFAGASQHLSGIMPPERRLTAEQLAADLTGIAVLNIATVTARGEPRVSAVDGHFLHG